MKKIPYNKQYIDDDDIQAVIRGLKSDFLTTGPNSEAFENKLKDYCQSKFAAVCSSGTSALEIIIKCLNLKKNDVIVSSAISFIAGANATILNNLKVKFCDVDTSSGNMNLNFLENILKTEKNVKVVMPVHLAGEIVNLEKLSQMSKFYDFKIIEDACHALGGSYNTKDQKNIKIGSCKHSDAAVFSFHPIKSITTGEGGAITTNNKDLHDKFKLLRSHGVTRDENLFKNKKLSYTKFGETKLLNKWYYEMHDLSHNFRITDFQCALGISQLKKIDFFIKKRGDIASKYFELFSKVERDLVQFPSCNKNYLHAYHLFIVFIKFNKLKGGRAKLMRDLENKGIQTQVNYIPIYYHPFYRKMFGKLDLSGCKSFYNKCLSLPIYPSMKFEDVEYVVNSLVSLIKKNKIKDT